LPRELQEPKRGKQPIINEPYWVEDVIVVHINTPQFNVDGIYYTLIIVWTGSYLNIYIYILARLPMLINIIDKYTYIYYNTEGNDVLSI